MPSCSHGSVREDPFDAAYGTDTCGVIAVGSLDIPEDQLEHSMHYGPIWEDEFTATMKVLPIVSGGLTFIDLGSGKGRALLLASLYPFRRIIGVELSEMLHQTALHNIQIFKDNRMECHDIQAICMDAALFNLPAEPILLFLCNPFDDHVMGVVMSCLRESLRKHSRPFYIWYVKPVYRKVLDDADFLKTVIDTGRYVFYEATGIPPN